MFWNFPKMAITVNPAANRTRSLRYCSISACSFVYFMWHSKYVEFKTSDTLDYASAQYNAQPNSLRREAPPLEYQIYTCQDFIPEFAFVTALLIRCGVHCYPIILNIIFIKFMSAISFHTQYFTSTCYITDKPAKN